VSDLLFWILAPVLTLCALGVVLSRSLYRAAYWLAGALVTTAVFYLALTSPLLAAVQILLYTGGLLTLVVFALVITASGGTQERRWRRPWAAAVLAGLVLLVLVGGIGEGTVPLGDSPRSLDASVEIGAAVFTRYLVPFELLSVLLLGAIFGALAIARREERR